MAMADYFCAAILRGSFWVNAKERSVTLFWLRQTTRQYVPPRHRWQSHGNGPLESNITRESPGVLCRLHSQHERTVGSAPGWKVENMPVESLLSRALQNWDEDSTKGVEDRLNSTAYMMLGKYGIFEERNRCGADFSGKVEKGWGLGNLQLKQKSCKLAGPGSMS